MKKNKITIIFILAGLLIFLNCGKKKEEVQRIKVERGDIKIFVNANGAVMPQNRLQIKPPLSGRIEKILVREGEYVKSGQVLAYMSSTDRATIIDAARAKGENIKEWEEIYKPISIIAPINGQIIVRAMEPGQTVTQADTILVLSDRLIIKVQVDETDIGKVQKGQFAEIIPDAYPEEKIKGVVDHIYYESKIVNNVTIYEVDVLPEKIPDFLRSGMSCNVNIIQMQKQNILLVPVRAVKKEKTRESFVILVKNGKKEKVAVQTGISDGENTEIISGLNENDEILLITQKTQIKKSQQETKNPFVPQRPGQRMR